MGWEGNSNSCISAFVLREGCQTPSLEIVSTSPSPPEEQRLLDYLKEFNADIPCVTLADKTFAADDQGTNSLFIYYAVNTKQGDF